MKADGGCLSAFLDTNLKDNSALRETSRISIRKKTGNDSIRPLSEARMITPKGGGQKDGGTRDGPVKI